MNVNALMINIQLTQRVVLGLCAALAVLVCFTFIYSAWQWRADWVLAHQAAAAPTVATVDETANMIAAIPDEHLFGQSFSKSGMPTSNLQLRVTGIVKVDNEQGGTVSKAYISISGQPSKIYQTGDSLPYGVKVYDIAPDAVILENDGHLEKLPLPREQLQFKPRNKQESM